MVDRKTQVVVIGGGLSGLKLVFRKHSKHSICKYVASTTCPGLSAAKVLYEAGIGVVLLEARDRVGGRTYTVQNDKCKWVDLGGAYVGPTQNRLLRLVRELGIKHYLVNERQYLVMLENGKSSKFRGNVPPFSNPIKLMDLNHLLRKMDEYGEEIPVDAPWNAPRAKEWDSISTKEFFDKVVWTKSVRRFADIMLEVCVTAEPAEVSLLWWLWYVRACQGCQKIISTTNGGQERKFDGGSMQISEKLAEKLGIGERVLLNKPVNGIIQNESGAVVTTVDGSKYECDQVILATAPGMQMKIYHDPPLPPMRNQLIQRVPMGCVIKMHLYYETAHWIESDMCGSSMILDEGLEHPCIFTLDDTKRDGTHPCIIGFLAANKGRTWMTHTKEERANAISKSMARVFNNDKLLNYIHYEEKNWMEEQWSGGCYTACLPPNVLTQYGKALREPTGRIHYAGTETAIHWSGYMEGAVQAGERAARQILYGMGKVRKEEIWQDDAEDKECFPRPVPCTLIERHLPSVPGFLKLIACSALTSVAIGVGAFLNHYDKF